MVIITTIQHKINIWIIRNNNENKEGCFLSTNQ